MMRGEVNKNRNTKISPITNLPALIQIVKNETQKQSSKPKKRKGNHQQYYVKDSKGEYIL